MDPRPFFQELRQLIARDDLSAALLQLRTLLEQSPLLDEAILQSARFQDVRKQIRLGMVSHAEANLTQNQIRAGLLELLREIEHLSQGRVGVTSTHADIQALRQEVERAISIVKSKNVVVSSTITAGGNVEIGDRTIHTESDTSRRLRLFLYLFVPLLAVGGAFLWVRLQKMSKPLMLTVAVDNRTPNPELPFEGGTVTLQYGDKSETLPVRPEQTEVDFKGIPANFEGETLSLHFKAPGFAQMDTTFLLSGNRLSLPIRRDNSLARVFGTVHDERGNPLAGIQIRVQDLTTVTDAAGVFSLAIPFAKQRAKQRITASLAGYAPWDNTSPVIENEEIPIILRSN